MKTRIINGKIILPDGRVECGYLEFENGKITRVETGAALFCEEVSGNRNAGTGGSMACTDGEGAEIIDAGGNYISPGFIDVHTHGAGGHDFMDGTVEAYLGAAATHARYGTTSLVPTTLTSTDEDLWNTFAVYKEAKSQNREGAELLGLHLEGPYFAYNLRGAQDPKYLRNPDPAEYEKILAASDDIVRWSLAPELPGALEFAQRLREVGILPAIAHTDALYEEVLQAYDAGFSLVTHLYSCMSTITRRNAFRYAGVLEAAYMLDGMAVEVIADGIHVPASLLQYVCKFKASDKIILVTDSMRAAGMPEGEYMLGSLQNGQPIIVEDGVAKLPDRSAFAGSVATADRLVRTMVKLAEITLPEAVRMVTRNPAEVMNLSKHKGSLEVGKDADIVLFDDSINVSRTIVGGLSVYASDAR